RRSPTRFTRASTSACRRTWTSARRSNVALKLATRAPDGALVMLNGPVAILELAGVSKHFGAIQALIDVSLTLHEGEVVGLMGDNGAGKSTLVKIIAGNFPASGGTLTLQGEKVAFHKPADAREAGIE